MFRTTSSLCMTVLLISGLCTPSAVHPAKEPSVMTPLVGGLISGGMANYALGQATVESEREWANAVLYCYQNHLAIYSMDTIERVYRILSMTDEQLARDLYWRKILGTLGAGCSVAALLYCILNRDSLPCRSSYDVHIPLYNPYPVCAAPCPTLSRRFYIG